MDYLRPIPDECHGSLRATAVIVLYGLAPEESPAFRSLVEARARIMPALGRISIVLWDNSPSSRSDIPLPEDVTYVHDPRNPGLAGAYNASLEMALRRGSKWLITLDQDTIVPPDYLVKMANAERRYSSCAAIGAIVPQIAVGAKRLSPNYFVFGAIPRWFSPGFRGIPRAPVSAFNSGAMLRTDALRQSGGYDTRFPVDYSDAAMFHLLHEHGKRVYVDGAIQLEHEFSMTDMNQRMKLDRYRRAMLAESAFWDLYMNWLAGCERTARLALRMVRHWMRNDRRELRHVTLQFLFLRLFRSKKTRLRRWRESLQAVPVLAPERAEKSRPKVSVCMAAYNGARFIEAQIASILPQLAPEDEVVIVDDGSQDDTVARISEIRDSRIRLYAHEKNQGVVATFEDALRCATGNILFLSDDDDLWAPNKVDKVLQAFEQHEEAQVVASRVALIDEQGAALPDARVNRFGTFRSGFWDNVIKNHYQGSAMAIRASFLGKVLPFPRGKSFLHDVWIGTRNDARGGKTIFIDEPLVYYRRHSQNASQRHEPLRMLKVRLNLLIAHMTHSLS